MICFRFTCFQGENVSGFGMVDIWKDEGLFNFFFSFSYLWFFRFTCSMWVVIDAFAGQQDSKKKTVTIVTCDLN